MQGTKTKRNKRRSQTWQIKVKGSKWRYRLLSPELYEKNDFRDGAAATVSSSNTMYFRVDDLAWGHCVHELFHAYVSELHLDSASSLTKEDFEEIIAEMLEKYIVEITEKATSMYANMTRSEVR